VAFGGIPLAALDFYEDLEDDNSKAFWTAHKAVYDDSVKAPLEALAAELAPEFGPAKLFRPYRDVRFAKDKTPYKIQQGVWFGESNRYLEVSAAGLRVAGGMYYLSSDQIARYRRAVDDDIPAGLLETALDHCLKAGLEIRGEQLTRVPAGFDKQHPRSDLLRRKALTTGRQLGSPAWLSTPRAKAEVVKRWRAMTPLVDWLNKHVGPPDVVDADRSR
jgi:uncharacterized protein (TIGR02453 family)